MPISRFIRQFYLPLPEGDLEELAQTLKAEFEITGHRRPRAIFRFQSGWRIDLRYRNEQDKKLTRFSAPILPHDFHFSISKQSLWSNLKSKFRRDPQQMPLPWLGKDMVAYTNDPARLERLLQNEQVRSLLKDERQFSFGLVPVSRTRPVNDLPVIYSMLVYEIKGYTDYPSRLRKIIAFFLLLLQQLSQEEVARPLTGQGIKGGKQLTDKR